MVWSHGVAPRIVFSLADRVPFAGRQIDKVVAGAVTTHSKDWNLAREAVLSTSLSPLCSGASPSSRSRKGGAMSVELNMTDATR